MTSLPYPTVFFASVKEIACRHRDDQFAHGGKTINVSFEELSLRERHFL